MPRWAYHGRIFADEALGVPERSSCRRVYRRASTAAAASLKAAGCSLERATGLHSVRAAVGTDGQAGILWQPGNPAGACRPSLRRSTPSLTRLRKLR